MRGAFAPDRKELLGPTSPGTFGRGTSVRRYIFERPNMGGIRILCTTAPKTSIRLTWRLAPISVAYLARCPSF